MSDSRKEIDNICDIPHHSVRAIQICDLIHVGTLGDHEHDFREVGYHPQHGKTLMCYDEINDTCHTVIYPDMKWRNDA